METAGIATLSRGDNHIVKIELDGYQLFEATLTKKTSGWVWGNIVFGGLIIYALLAARADSAWQRIGTMEAAAR